MSLPTIHGDFTVVADPELRFTPSGAAVCNVRLVANKSKKNEQTNEWEQTHTFWINGSIWRQAAENMAESLQKGMNVTVIGQIYTREYEKDGEKRSVVELDIFSIGPSLKFQTAKVSKAARQGGGSGSGSPSAPADDPWATPPGGDEPPF